MIYPQYEICILTLNGFWKDQSHQEETRRPIHKFRCLFLNLLLIGWRGCTRAMGVTKLPPFMFSPKPIVQSIYKSLHMQLVFFRYHSFLSTKLAVVWIECMNVFRLRTTITLWRLWYISFINPCFATFQSWSWHVIILNMAYTRVMDDIVVFLAMLYIFAVSIPCFDVCQLFYAYNKTEL